MNPWDVLETALRIVQRYLDTDDAHFIAAQLVADYGAAVLDGNRDWREEVREAQWEVERYAKRHAYYAPWNPWDEEDWAYLENRILETLQERGEHADPVSHPSGP
ncbi:hypothetical protein OO015_00455 [Thermomicrobium sp. 4228-Ro]|uniref:hypothetical protein n=1 Tax=Thermomicrobium sp. 4228-Ro TaxID=2993937 RepID=UPI002248A2D8|nr:hypothetical protein [Thermomicrobium sp. 4228-Ro]MCX2725978.1 hypothetical protein [Thermomicrobium sp. 4228-Ro]